MSYYTRQQPGSTSSPGNPPYGQNTGCEPEPDPADQPKDPAGKCDKPSDTQPPELKEPEKCPDPPCNCPSGPTTTSTCLDDMIAKQGSALAEAERTKVFKADLEALLAKAKTAKQEYTTDKYEKLVDEWKKQDAQIVELIRKLDCAVPCWWCLIECHICKLLYEIRYREQKLYGDGTLYTEVKNLHDLRYWHEQDRDQKKRIFDRVKNVLSAWEKPAQTIEKVLADNAKLIVDAGKFLGPDTPKLVYDVFLRLVPLHLAIAPPASVVKTNIRKEYTKFCECDEGTPDDCCGPDVGVPSVRARVIGPQPNVVYPYLVHPNLYFDILCCLVKERYEPAKTALAKAEAAFQAVDADVKRYAAEIEERMKSFEKDARGAIPNTVDCCSYKQRDPNQQPSGATAR
jgi:hypothetical protein